MSTQAIYEEWKQKVEAEGVMRGLQQGIQQGMQQGMQQGIQKGIERGLQHAVKTTYEARFGALPAEVAARLSAVHDTEELNALLTLVATRSAEELAAALQGTPEASPAT